MGWEEGVRVGFLVRGRSAMASITIIIWARFYVYMSARHYIARLARFNIRRYSEW
jgi:hypothetical protein